MWNEYKEIKRKKKIQKLEMNLETSICKEKPKKGGKDKQH